MTFPTPSPRRKSGKTITKAWMVCVLKGNGIVPVFPKPMGGINGFPTVYETKEEAVKQWDGWGFVATVVPIQIEIMSEDSGKRKERP